MNKIKDMGKSEVKMDSRIENLHEEIRVFKFLMENENSLVNYKIEEWKRLNFKILDEIISTEYLMNKKSNARHYSTRFVQFMLILANITLACAFLFHRG